MGKNGNQTVWLCVVISVGFLVTQFSKMKNLSTYGLICYIYRIENW